MKDALRKEMIALRNSFSKEDLRIRSTAACNRLLATDIYKQSRSVFCFLSFGSEIQTDMIVSDALLVHKELYVPYIDRSTGRMHPVRINANTTYQKNVMGIAEPAFDPQALIPDHFDLVIVPGLLFDRQGYRIGYGKGYYDQFLSAANVACKAGLAFFCQIKDAIPTEDHDQKVDLIITEKEILTISTRHLPNNEIL